VLGSGLRGTVSIARAHQEFETAVGDYHGDPHFLAPRGAVGKPGSRMR
jgi:hypothetical protein